MNEIGIKDQCFGVEVEMTGITREQAAQALAEYFGTSPEYLGTFYDTWGVTDPEGKVWKLMSDSCQRQLKMLFFAEMKCHFSRSSIQVYTALITVPLAGLKPVKS